jgi:hypothetical protein
MKDVVIFGAVRFAELVHHYVTVDGGWQVDAFTING